MNTYLFTHDVLTFISSAIIAVMGIFMMRIRIPHNVLWNGYRRMRLILSVSFFVLSCSGFASSMAQVEEENPKMLSAMTLVVAAYQAMLFTATTRTFVAPQSVGVRHLLARFSVITLVGALLMALLIFLPRAFAVAFVLSVLAYVVQLVVYYRNFMREYEQCVERLEAHYDEDESGRLRWIKHCFMSALGIGVMALFFSVLPVSIAAYDCFVVAYTLYYVYMTGCMMDYRNNNAFIVMGGTSMPQVVEKEDTSEVEPEKAVESDETEKEFEKMLNCWVEAKKFTQKDITPEEIALQLGTTRRYMVWYFSTRKQTTFRTWRLKLRIAEAERILREEEGVTVAALHEMVGVGDKSNFHKQFKQSTGMTPTEYKARFSKSN